MRGDVEKMVNHEELCTNEWRTMRDYVQLMENHEGLCTDDGEP